MDLTKFAREHNHDGTNSAYLEGADLSLYATEEYVDDAIEAIDHDDLQGIDAAGAGVTNGHISADAQTIAGIKTFSSIPVLPASAPTTDNQASRKKYVDDSVSDMVTITDDQTITGRKIMRNSSGLRVEAASGQDGIEIRGRAGGTASRDVDLIPAALTASRVQTLQDKGGTIPVVDTQTSASATDFPIGHTVLALFNQTTNWAANASVTVRIQTDGNLYGDYGTGTALTGTWRIRGKLVGTSLIVWYLIQRTA